MRRWLRASLLVACSPLLSGCCALAGLLCGPDRSEWISVSFRSPAETIATLREALRRDHLDTLYSCLSEDYKRQHDLSQISLTILWERLRDEVPGIHLLGEAEVSEPERLDARHVRYVLTYGSTQIAVRLVRQHLVEVRYRVPEPPGTPDEPAARYVASLAPHLRLLETDEFAAQVQLTIADLMLPPGITATDLTSVTAMHQWKVDDLRRVEDGAEVVPKSE